MPTTYEMVTMPDAGNPDPNRSIPVGASFSMHPAADGWPVRFFDWPQTGTARGSILFQTGRGDLIEKYLETCAHWHALGWSVRSLDWRGQGGSGRLASNPKVGHMADFAPWIDDLAEFAAEWQSSTPGPHIIIGHSMGGHLVLRGLAEGRVAPDAVVLIAPMLGFDSGMPRWLAAGLARVLARLLGPNRFAWPDNEKPSLPGVSRQLFLTHDDRRYADELWWRDAHPENVIGPPSWPWLAASYRSFAMLEAPGVLEAIRTPVLTVATQGDKLVSPGAIRRAIARLNGSQLLMFDKRIAHEILREADAPRNEALKVIDAFMESVGQPL